MPSWLGRPYGRQAALFLLGGFRSRPMKPAEQNRTVVIEFESVEVARAAHDSPGYQEALAALGDGAVRDVRIVPAAD